MNEADAVLDLAGAMTALEETVLRVKEERDEAVRLLRRVLDVREMGLNGPIKSDIRAFLKSFGMRA